MRGPLERIRRRVTTSDERPALTSPADAPTHLAADADDASRPSPETPRADDASRVPEARAPATDVPAGLDAGALARQENVRRRGRARRRLRYLERAREVLLRDLGGLVFEIHRSGELGRHDELVAVKAQRLLQVDAEARELANGLGRPWGEVVLRKPGLGGTCPRCGELHGSDARFCSHCGLALTGSATSSTAADRATGSTASGEATRTTATDPATGATASDAATGATARDDESSPGGPNGGAGRTQDTEALTIHVQRP
jgi:hypothetical protein